MKLAKFLLKKNSHAFKIKMAGNSYFMKKAIFLKYVNPAIFIEEKIVTPPKSKQLDLAILCKEEILVALLNVLVFVKI